jgi:haloalkane dehalogenase
VTATLDLRPVPRPEWLFPSVWPFQSYAVESNGSVLAVTEAGMGPTLLLVHVGMWSFIWRDLVLRLSSDFRCVFFDAPGTGQTRTPPGQALTIDGAGRAVSDVIAALGLTDFTLVVHDLGGPAALSAIAGVRGRVRGIVGMNAFGWRPEGAALRGMLALMGSGFMREIDALTGFLPRIASSAFGAGRRLDALSRGVFLAGVGPAARRAFHRYMHDALRCDGLYARVERALKGPLSRVPLLTIFGERNDPFGFQKRWREFYPDARQEVVAKGNHFPMCDAPDFVARVIRDWYAGRVG